MARPAGFAPLPARPLTRGASRRRPGTCGRRQQRPHRRQLGNAGIRAIFFMGRYSSMFRSNEGVRCQPLPAERGRQSLQRESAMVGAEPASLLRALALPQLPPRDELAQFGPARGHEKQLVNGAHRLPARGLKLALSSGTACSRVTTDSLDYGTIPPLSSPVIGTIPPLSSANVGPTAPPPNRKKNRKRKMRSMVSPRSGVRAPLRRGASCPLRLQTVAGERPSVTSGLRFRRTCADRF